MNNRKNIILFFAVHILFSMTCSFAHPVTPALFKELALPDYMFGVALACMSLGNVLFSPFWGKAAGLVSSRKILLISCCGYGVGQLLFAMCKSVLAVVIVRFLTGIFVGGIFVGMLTYMVNTAPDEQTRARFLVWSATADGVFNSVGYFIGGMLGEISVYVSVIVQAACLLVCAVSFRLFCVDDTRAPRQKIEYCQLLREVGIRRSFAQGLPLLRCAIGLLLIVCALQSFSQTCFDQSFNYYVTDQMGLGTAYNGVFKGVMGLVTLLANATLCTFLIRKTDTRKTVIAVLAGCALLMLSILWLTELLPFIILNILFFALSAVSLPMLRDLVAKAGDIGGHDSNLVMGFYNALKNFGSIFGALLAGFTYIVTPKTPFVCCMGGMLLAAAIAAVYAFRNRADKAA